MLTHKTVSPSRVYVAICWETRGTNEDGSWKCGFKFRKFHLPEEDERAKKLKNDSSAAAGYFLYFLDSVACIEGCVSIEDFEDFKWHYSQAESR